MYFLKKEREETLIFLKRKHELELTSLELEIAIKKQKLGIELLSIYPVYFTYSVLYFFLVKIDYGFRYKCIKLYLMICEYFQ